MSTVLAKLAARARAAGTWSVGTAVPWGCRAGRQRMPQQPSPRSNMIQVCSRCLMGSKGGGAGPQTHRALGSSGNCKLPKVSGRSRMMEEDAEVTVSRREPGRGGEKAAAELSPSLSRPHSSPPRPPKKPHATLASY